MPVSGVCLALFLHGTLRDVPQAGAPDGVACAGLPYRPRVCLCQSEARPPHRVSCPRRSWSSTRGPDLCIASAPDEAAGSCSRPVVHHFPCGLATVASNVCAATAWVRRPRVRLVAYQALVHPLDCENSIHAHGTQPLHCRSRTAVDGKYFASKTFKTERGIMSAVGHLLHEGLRARPLCNVDWQNFLHADTLGVQAPTLHRRGAGAP